MRPTWGLVYWPVAMCAVVTIFAPAELIGETEASVSGWTTDTLREHLNQKLADQRNALVQQILDQRDAFQQQIADLRDSGRLMTTDLREAVRQQADDHRRMLDERYATQTKALDAAFKAAEQAVAVALANAEKATNKAETAADVRFQSVNEFRQALADQTATFLPRTEYRTAHDGLVERVATNADRLGALELRLTSRLDVGEGTRSGATGERTERRLDTGTALTAASVLVGFLILAVALYAALHH